MRKWLGILVVGWLAACGDGTSAKTQQTDAAATADTTGADATADTAADTSSDAETDAVALSGKATFETADPKRIVVLNYNVMCSFCVNSDHLDDWEQDWHVRLPWLRDVIHRHDPDLLALQELQEIVPGDPTLTQPQQMVLPDNAYDFEFYHHQPGDLFDQDYDDATVFWKKARFEKKDTGVFWLSPTPDQSYSTGFKQPQEPRMVVWVLLHDKVNGRDFYFANTHFDNNAPSQKLSAPLVLERLGKLAGQHPLIFAGDFNSDPKTEAYAILTKGVDGAKGGNSSGFHFDDTLHMAKIANVLSNVEPPPLDMAHLEDIDHIFVAGAQFDVTWWLTDFWRYGAKMQAPSDHNGALVTSVNWP